MWRDWDEIQRIKTASCFDLAKRLGIKYEPMECCEDPNAGADIAISRLARETAKACGEVRFGKRASDAPVQSSEDERHLMTEYYELVRFFAMANHYFSDKKTFIDLGCGSGFPTALALRLGYRAFGVDKDENIVSLARENLRGLGLDSRAIVQGDFTSDSFWKTSLGSENPRGFDFYYMHDYWENVMKNLPVISKKIFSGGRIILPYWESDSRLNSEHAKKYLDSLGIEHDPLSAFMMVWLKKKG